MAPPGPGIAPRIVGMFGEIGEGERPVTAGLTKRNRLPRKYRASLLSRWWAGDERPQPRPCSHRILRPVAVARPGCRSHIASAGPSPRAFGDAARRDSSARHSAKSATWLAVAIPEHFLLPGSSKRMAARSPATCLNSRGRFAGSRKGKGPVPTVRQRPDFHGRGKLATGGLDQWPLIARNRPETGPLCDPSSKSRNHQPSCHSKVTFRHPKGTCG